MASARLFAFAAAAAALGGMPCCHGLHAEDIHLLDEAPGRAPAGETLVFGVHHKTGTELAHDVSDCFDPLFKHKEVQMFTCSELPRNERAVHFTRNPINLALSAYLYHKEEGEDWTWKHGSAEVLLHDDAYSRSHVKGDEAYTQFLRRVSHRVGIRAEIFRLSSAGGEFDQIQTGMRNCGNTKRCIEICLEDFTVSSSSFDLSWRRVLHFMGKELTPKLHQCLAKEDLHRHTTSTDHVTSNTLSEEMYNELWKMVWEVDNLSFGSKLKKLGHGRLNCGGAAKFLTRSSEGANTTYGNGNGERLAEDALYGGGYKEWLIEEEYSKTWGA